jgi:hypothetical protein
MRTKRIVTCSSALLVLGLVLAPLAAAGKGPRVKNGVVHACLKTKGKKAQRGTIHVVSSPKQCKKKKGEQALTWSLTEATGAAGTAGTAGVQNLPATVNTLTATTSSLTAGATNCKQIATLGEGVNTLGTSVTGLATHLATVKLLGLPIVELGEVPTAPKTIEKPKCE